MEEDKKESEKRVDDRQGLYVPNKQWGLAGVARDTTDQLAMRTIVSIGISAWAGEDVEDVVQQQQQCVIDAVIPVADDVAACPCPYPIKHLPQAT